MSFKNRYKWVIAVTFCVLLSACGDSYESSIPSVRFNLSYSISHFPTITTPGYFVKVEKNVNGISVGYAGLILGKSLFYGAMGDNNYICYDAACPVEAQRGVSINLLDEGTGKAECPKCGMEYDLNNNGYPLNGDRNSEYLKRYPVVVNGTTLIVRN